MLPRKISIANYEGHLKKKGVQIKAVLNATFLV